MGEILVKRFEEPDEIVTTPNHITKVVVFGETYVAWSVYEPGWHWSKDVKPLVGTQSCQIHHRGLLLSGYMQIVSDQGVQRLIGPGEAYDVHPGHVGWVVGDEPCVSVEYFGVREWAKSSLAARVLTTLLYTDIVGSTAHVARLGDVSWKGLLARHYDRVRLELEKHHGEESKTTGDGLLALFDSAARAAICAAAICRVSRQDGIEVRIGVHTGEVERHLEGIQGLAVHVAKRVMDLAGPGEVLLSAATVAILEGTGLSFSDFGEHELKGVEGRRHLYRLNAADVGHNREEF